MINLAELFLIFLRLGLTSFGGPVAHLGYFQNEFVLKRRWFDEQTYADLVALCQFLPGPSSSQVGLAIGFSRAGLPGAIAAWLGFTLPSALLMIGFALGLSKLQGVFSTQLFHGLKIVAVAVVAQAIWTMGKALCTDRLRASLAALSAIAVTLAPFAFSQVLVIALAAFFGWLFLKEHPPSGQVKFGINHHLRSGAIVLFTFALSLATLPILAEQTQSQGLKLFDRFFRAGSLVFGGGHVVLPLLKAEVVDRGLVSSDTFLAGYGFAQALPGPLFTFAAYLGAMMRVPPSGIGGGLLCLVAAFLPSFFLVGGALPFWDKLRAQTSARSAIAGVNAAVVGLLVAAFYQPIWTSAILAPKDFAFAVICFGALQFWKVPAWALAIVGSAFGFLTS